MSVKKKPKCSCTAFFPDGRCVDCGKRDPEMTVGLRSGPFAIWDGGKKRG